MQLPSSISSPAQPPQQLAIADDGGTSFPTDGASSSWTLPSNISCTNFLSKLCESFVLDWTREQVRPKDNQFGGEKGCGSTHFLIEALDEITTTLEDNRSASVITSIDFSKAFNRLEHLSCLRAFERKGASTEIISILSSFMSDRIMTVRVGQEHSEMRPVNPCWARTCLI